MQTRSIEARQIISELTDTKTRFDAAASARKRAALRSIIDAPEKLRFASGRAILTLHDLLLFIAAYPGTRAINSLAEQTLARLAPVIARRAAGSKTIATALKESGVAGSAVSLSQTLPLVRWLVETFPDDIEIDWDENESGGKPLDALLHIITSISERDGLYALETSTRAWFDLARGKQSAARATIRRLDQFNLPPNVAENMFESLELPLKWTMSDHAVSRTLLRFPDRPIFVSRNGIRKSSDIARQIRKPVSEDAGRRLNPRDAERMIWIARCALASRGRETDPVTHANPSEVWLFQLERGIDIAIFGMMPDRRLPIESFFGYVLARNRVPASYGGGWVFLNRCDIGINIFPEMRGGESAFIFAQILRLYRHLFDVHRFTVDPFQFGADNNEAIRTGAFWFYRRFGFEPIDPKLRAIANDEWQRIENDRNYRTPASTLRRLAKGPIALDLVDEITAAKSAPPLPPIGLRVTRLIGRRFDGDRLAAEKWAGRKVRKTLGLNADSYQSWTDDERAGFNQLSLALASSESLLEAIRDWPGRAKRDLAALLRSKGGLREMEYARRARHHAGWREALFTLAREDVEAT